jgi:hypothetical protein
MKLVYADKHMLLNEGVGCKVRYAAATQCSRLLQMRYQSAITVIDELVHYIQILSMLRDDVG